MSVLTDRKLVAFSTGNNSGLMFYVSCDAQTEEDLRVFISYMPVIIGAQPVITLERCEFYERPSVGCRCPKDDGCSHRKTFYVYHRGQRIVLDVVRDCTQLNPDDYLIQEMRDAVIINDKTWRNVLA